MNKIKNLLCVLLFFTVFLGHQTSSAQSHPLKISILDESISFPNFWFLKYPYNPAVIVGTEHILSQKKNHDWHLTGNLGFYHHKKWQNTIFLQSEIGYRYHIKRFSISPKFGIGYAHIFSPKPTYGYSGGQFKEIKNAGDPTFMPSLNIELGYKLKSGEASPEVFVTFMESAEIPFTIATGLHQFVGLGFKFYPFKK